MTPEPAIGSRYDYAANGQNITTSSPSTLATSLSSAPCPIEQVLAILVSQLRSHRDPNDRPIDFERCKRYPREQGTFGGMRE
jgi:hypothetical protein